MSLYQMRHAKRKASKAVKKFAKKHVKKVKQNDGINSMMVNKSTIDRPLPDRFHVVYKTTSMATVLATETDDLYFTVYANSPFEPFNTSNPIGGTTMAGTLSTGFSITDQPVGYSILNNSNTYIRGKCHESRIQVRFTPYGTSSSSGVELGINLAENDGELCVVPISSSESFPSTFAIASRMNYAKKKRCRYTDVNNFGITTTLKNHKIEGLTKAEYNSQLQNSGTGFSYYYTSEPTSPQYWLVLFQTFINSGGTDSVALAGELEVTVWHYCELYALDYSAEAAA